MEALVIDLNKHADVVAGLISSISVGVVAAVWYWVTNNGGRNAIRSWLATLQASDREEAKASIRKGLRIAGHGGVSEEESVNQLISGMDRWRLLESKQRGRLRGLSFAKWLTVGLIVLAGTVWICRILEHGVPTACLVWFLLLCGLIWYAGPIAVLAFDSPPTRPTEQSRNVQQLPGQADHAVAVAGGDSKPESAGTGAK